MGPTATSERCMLHCIDWPKRDPMDSTHIHIYEEYQIASRVVPLGQSVNKETLLSIQQIPLNDPLT